MTTEGNNGARPTVLVTRRIAAAAIEKIRQLCTVRQWDSDEAIARATLLEWAAGVDGIYCLLTERIDGELMDAAGPQLRVVSTMSVGYDHVDLAACTARGVAVGNTPDVLTETTADLALALMLTVARRLPEAMAAVRSGAWGTWRPEWMTGVDLYGSTVGIVGMGRIGMAVARRLAGFGCRILYTNPGPRDADAVSGATAVDLATLVAESDFVTIHAPLTADTRGLFDGPVFRRMKRSAILINTSRGPLVDQEALYEALHDGVIAGAGLDVTSPEPLPPTHRLLTLPNCVVLPHIGSATAATRLRMAMVAAENLLAGVTGQPLPHQVR